MIRRDYTRWWLRVAGVRYSGVFRCLRVECSLCFLKESSKVLRKGLTNGDLREEGATTLITWNGSTDSGAYYSLIEDRNKREYSYYSLGGANIWLLEDSEDEGANWGWVSKRWVATRPNTDFVTYCRIEHVWMNKKPLIRISRNTHITMLVFFHIRKNSFLGRIKLFG